MSTKRTSSGKSEITRLLESWAAGEADALDRLFPLVVDELRLIARSYVAREAASPLQPTELIGEVCIKLLGQKKVHWESRSQFFAFSAELMRRILVDSARRQLAAKRKAVKVPFEEAFGLSEKKAPDVLAVDEAVKELEKLNPRQARIVEMRVFGGWTVEEIAEALSIAPMTVKRQWRGALLWLRRELSQDEAPPGRPAPGASLDHSKAP